MLVARRNIAGSQLDIQDMQKAASPAACHTLLDGAAEVWIKQRLQQSGYKMHQQPDQPNALGQCADAGSGHGKWCLIPMPDKCGLSGLNSYDYQKIWVSNASK